MFCECPRLVAQLHQAKEISLTDELDAFDSGECACARGREAVVDHRLHSLSRFRNLEVHYIGRYWTYEAHAVARLVAEWAWPDSKAWYAGEEARPSQTRDCDFSSSLTTHVSRCPSPRLVELLKRSIKQYFHRTILFDTAENEYRKASQQRASKVPLVIVCKKLELLPAGSRAPWNVKR